MKIDKDRITLGVIRIAGILAAIIFVIVKIPFLATSLVSGCFYDHGDYYGDCYVNCKVRYFKELLPPATGNHFTSDVKDIDKYSVLTIGDSFFNRYRGNDAFPFQLSRSLNERVFYNGTAYHNPFLLLQDVHKDKNRILILESAERLIMDRFSKVPNMNPEKSKKASTGIRLALEEIRNCWFVESELNYRFFIENSIFTSPLVESWRSLNFKYFGKISSSTPIYCLKPPVLFLDQETNRNWPTSFYSVISDEAISHVADCIQSIRDELRDKYHTELIFLPVPNKYSIEHTYFNQDSYNQFLPRLYSELKKRHIATVELYDRFCSSKEELYFRSDSHWNGRGVSIALDELLKVMNIHKEQNNLK
jgi:hypothetical protein